MDYAVPLVLVALALVLCAAAWWLHERAQAAAVVAEAEAYLQQDRKT